MREWCCLPFAHKPVTRGSVCAFLIYRRAINLALANGVSAGLAARRYVGRRMCK